MYELTGLISFISWTVGFAVIIATPVLIWDSLKGRR